MTVLVFRHGEVVERSHDNSAPTRYARQVMFKGADLEAASPCQGGGYYLKLRYVDEAHALLYFDTAEEAIEYLLEHNEFDHPEYIRINPERLLLRLTKELSSVLKHWTDAGVRVHTTGKDTDRCDVSPSVFRR